MLFTATQTLYELTEVGLAAQGSSGHLGDEVVLGREERMRLQVQGRGQ